MIWPHGDPSVVVRAVLAQPAYRREAAPSSPPQASLFELAWKWFVEHVVAPLFAPIARAAGASGGVAEIAGVALIGLALLAIVFIVFRLSLMFVRSHTARQGSAGGTGSASLAPRRSSDWRDAARKAADRGEYAPAIAALFAGALAALDEAALIAFDAARSPTEYRRLVRRASAAAATPFDELAERFVRAAYASQATSRSDFEAAERAYAAFAPAVA